MQRIIEIKKPYVTALQAHLFKNNLEQGAFLFSNIKEDNGTIYFDIVDIYLVPADGWEIQTENQLELKDSERAKIMKKAKDGSYGIIDCHSHPWAASRVWFSPRDRTGIQQFASYVKWKLYGRPYVAMVFGRSSIDCVVWEKDFSKPYKVSKVRIVGSNNKVLYPCNSWWKMSFNEEFKGRFLHAW